MTFISEAALGLDHHFQVATAPPKGVCQGAGSMEFQSEAGWGHVYGVLTEWLKGVGEDTGGEASPPSTPAIVRAIEYANIMSVGMKFPAPSRVAADLNGGLVFEKADAEKLHSVHFYMNGQVEWLTFVVIDQI